MCKNVRMITILNDQAWMRTRHEVHLKQLSDWRHLVEREKGRSNHPHLLVGVLEGLGRTLAPGVEVASASALGGRDAKGVACLECKDDELTCTVPKARWLEEETAMGWGHRETMKWRG